MTPQYNYTYNDSFSYNVVQKGADEGPHKWHVNAFHNGELEWSGQFRDPVIAHETAGLWLSQCRALCKHSGAAA